MTKAESGNSRRFALWKPNLLGWKPRIEIPSTLTINDP